jgi:hypothetical protein
MDVPAIGKTRGIFEIFVPGVFLVINITGVLYLLAQNIKSIGSLAEFIRYIIGQPSLIIIILICFGYLIGMILRLLMTDLPDRLSAWYHRFFHRKTSTKSDGSYKSWSIEKFPYIEFMGELVLHNLSERSSPIYKFYRKVWEPRKRKDGNKRFFNFCKTMLLREGNEMTVMELNTNESINRYISGMFYSLLISFLLILLTIPFQSKSEVILSLFFILLSYLIGLWNIISRFRFIRIKEAQTLFDACYKNKEWFLTDSCVESTEEQKGIHKNVTD